jgi:hypothetical protein
MNYASKELLQSNLNLKIQALIAEFEDKTDSTVVNIHVIRDVGNNLTRIKCATIPVQNMQQASSVS